MGNHLLAVDATIFHLLMHYDYGRFLGPLDKTLFANKQYADAVIQLGAALGHSEVVMGLMSEGKDLLLYPGGTYEAVKQPEQRYELMWKKRYGFVRMAAKMGYTIVPFAAVGPDEYFDQHLTGPRSTAGAADPTADTAGHTASGSEADLIPPCQPACLAHPCQNPKPPTLAFAPPGPQRLPRP